MGLYSRLSWLKGFNISAWFTLTSTYANSEDPDEMACNQPSHLDLHCLPFNFFLFLSEIPISSSGRVQIQGWKSPYQKL